MSVGVPRAACPPVFRQNPRHGRTSRPWRHSPEAADIVHVTVDSWGGEGSASGVDVMSEPTYSMGMAAGRKPLVWLHGEVKTPPFTKEGRVEAGTLLRRLQEGERLGMPVSRPMSSI